MEYQDDFLADFQPIKQKFKNYYLIFGCHCLTILAIFLFSFNRLLFFFQPQFLMDAYFLYRIFLFFIYPLIGLFFFSTIKKIGWFIIAHYSSSLLVISVLICISNLVSNKVEKKTTANNKYCKVDMLLSSLFETRLLMHINTDITKSEEE